MDNDKPTYKELARRCREAQANVARLAAEGSRSEHIKQVLFAVRKINQLIATETDRGKLLERACELLTHPLAYLEAWIGMMDGGCVEATITAFSGSGDNFKAMGKILEQGRFPNCVNRVLEEKALVVVKDVRAECQGCPLAVEHVDDPRLSCALVLDSRICGILSVCIPAKYVYDFEERKLLEEVAADIALALRRLDNSRALSESEERYRSFVQNFQGIAFRGRMDFTPIFFHGAVEELTGYPEQEFLDGKPRWDEIVHKDDLPMIFCMAEKKLRSVADYSLEREYRIIRKDGEVRWVHEVIRNICDHSGKPVMVEGTIYDISKRKRVEAAL